jgi:hypothetical protein
MSEQTPFHCKYCNELVLYNIEFDRARSSGKDTTGIPPLLNYPDESPHNCMKKNDDRSLSLTPENKLFWARNYAERTVNGFISQNMYIFIKGEGVPYEALEKVYMSPDYLNETFYDKNTDITYTVKNFLLAALTTHTYSVILAKNRKRYKLQVSYQLKLDGKIYRVEEETEA